MNDSMMAASLSPGSGVNGVSSNENTMITNNNSNANAINGTNSNIMNNDLPPMIFRSMSDASAIRRQQQLQQQQLQQNLNNLSFHHHRNNNNNNQQNNIHFGTSWIEQQHRNQNNNNLLNHLISPGDGLSQRLFLNNTTQQQQQQQSSLSSSPLSSMFSNGKNIINNKQSNSCDQMIVANNNHNMINGGYKPFNSVVAGNKSSANPTANAVNIPNGGGNNSIAAGTLSPTNEDDYDLNLVFDEIGALQMKGLNEQEDDNSTAPLQLPSPRSLSLPGSSACNNIGMQPSGMLNTMMQQQQQQYDSPKQPSNTANNTENSKKQMSIIEVDKKTYKYDPEIYDQIDITLANEKYSLNARYLRDFRCEQCPQFLQHKCTQHKPFTCFDWHFANQRRRRPLRKKDGTFNYSPDIYCTKYDDTTGICPDGDDCPYLHRTAGDTERRYHLRYYKTGMCVYETDSRGYCVKNGAHCAFAHGSHDLRMAVFDVREQVQMAGNGNGAANNGNGGGNGDQVDGTVNNTDGNNNHHHCNGTNGGGSTSGNGGCSGTGHAANSATTCGGIACYLFDKDRNAVHEDPRWQNTAFVLAYYKTDICKRPPRLCRQGYACPQYHNNKDRRRSPKKFKYRSTPCPSVKQGDEWGDPSNCENKDECTYCHTRTEQQFHPEIYKSTKCNDVQQSGHCPRGPFCAFAHAENTDEINAAREFSMDPNTELPPSISGTTLGSSNNGKPTNGHIHSQTSPLEIVRANSYSRSSSSSNNNHNSLTMIASSLPEHCEFGNFDLNNAPHPMAHPDLSNTALHSNSGSNVANSANNTNNNLGPIARPRSFSTSNTTKTMSAMPSLGSWLDKNNPLFPGNGKALKTGPPQSATASSSSLFHPSSDNNAASVAIPLTQQQQPNASAPFSASLYGANDSVGSNSGISSVTAAAVIDTILNHHDLSFDELDNLVNNQHHHPKQNDNLHLLDATTANNNVAALSSMLRRSSLFNESEPINIPSHRMGGGGEMRSTSATGFNLSPPNHMSSTAAAAASPLYLAAANRQQSLPNGNGGSLFDQFNGGGPTPTNSLATSNQQHGYMSAAFMEMQRLKEENDMLKNRLVECQEKIQQVFRACQFEINEAIKKEKIAEKTRDEALNRLNNTQKELELHKTTESNALQKLVSTNDLSSMNRSQLLQLKQKLTQDLSLVEEALKILSG